MGVDMAAQYAAEYSGAARAINEPRAIPS